METKPSAKTKGKIHKKTEKEKCVSIECQRLNKDRVLEKINIDVSIGVFEALCETNPELLKNRRPEMKVEPYSADVYLEKSVQEVKSALQYLRMWRSGSKQRFGDCQTTCL